MALKLLSSNNCNTVTFFNLIFILSSNQGDDYTDHGFHVYSVMT